MTGGVSGNSGPSLSSTEQLVKNGGSWTIKENSLPARMDRLRTISFNNQIFTTGKANNFNKILFIYQNHSFYFQEELIGMLLFTRIKFCHWMKRQQPSKRLANWNKEDVRIQWVLLTSMILLVPKFEHVYDFSKNLFYLNYIFI